MGSLWVAVVNLLCVVISFWLPQELFWSARSKVRCDTRFGGTQRLVRRVGRQRALELMMTGRNVKADEAVSLGIALEKVSDDISVLDAALDLAKKISTNGPVAVELVKKVVDETDRMDTDLGLAVEASSFGFCFATVDQKRRNVCILSKRPANFEGK